MDYISVFTIIGVLGAFVFFLNNRMEREISKIHSEIKEAQKSIEELGRRMIRIEDRIEFSNKVVYIKSEKEEQKEN